VVIYGNSKRRRLMGNTMYRGEGFHNGIASYISTNPTGSLAAIYDILDRINQTFEDNSQDSIYYDSTSRITRSMYFAGNALNELGYDVIKTYLNLPDNAKIFEQLKANYGDIQNASELVVYEDAKVGADLVKVLDWANYNN
jgi:hypothetical protein